MAVALIIYLHNKLYRIMVEEKTHIMKRSSIANAVTMQLTVKNIAFDQSYIAVTAGAEITINFDNTDAMPHNFASYTDFGVTVLVFQVPE
jgi:plastocyanin